MANKCIDKIVYSFKRPKNGWGTIELIFDPHAIAYPWVAFKLNSFKHETLEVSQVVELFKTLELGDHIEVQIKESFGGAVHCYKNGIELDLENA